MRIWLLTSLRRRYARRPSDKSVVAKPEEDFEEFAPVDISELGD